MKYYNFRQHGTKNHLSALYYSQTYLGDAPHIIIRCWRHKLLSIIQNGSLLDHNRPYQGLFAYARGRIDDVS